MNDKPKTENKDYRQRGYRRIVTALISTNVLGATITFVYLYFIESGLRSDWIEMRPSVNIAFFLIVTSTLIIAVGATEGRYRRSLWKKLQLYSDGSDLNALRSVLDEVMNWAFRAAVITLLAWLCAGIVFALQPLLLQEWAGRPWQDSMHVFVGIVFVGAPFTVIPVYLRTEWRLRREIRELIPSRLLESVPKSVRINVLPKMLVVSLLIGIVPVSIISYVTLSQIHLIQADRLSIGSFLLQMPLVIGFLLLISVLFAIRLSIFVALSVSDPLRQVSAAMERISKGDLDLSVPVVSNDEIGSLTEGFNKMAQGLRERDLIRETFGSYVSPEVASEILKGPDALNLGGELREVTILIADLRRFTPLVASAPAVMVVQLLNRYFKRMGDIIMRHEGTIDELMGDGILAFFGAPRRVPDSQLRAVKCAIQMQRAMTDLNVELQETMPKLHFESERSPQPTEANSIQFPPRLSMGIAINSGPLIVGTIGYEKRKKYGAVGSPINVAFRVEKHAEANEILMTEEVYSKVAGVVDAISVPEVELKGIETPVTLYQLLGFKGASNY